MSDQYPNVQHAMNIHKAEFEAWLAERDRNLLLSFIVWLGEYPVRQEQSLVDTFLRKLETPDA